MKMITTNKKDRKSKQEIITPMLNKRLDYRNLKISKFLIFISLVIILLTGVLKADYTLITPYKDKIIFDTDIEPKLTNGNYKFVLKDGESLVVNYGKIGGKEVKAEYKNLKSSSTSQPTLIFDSVGRLIEANFKTGQDGKYIFGNEQIFLPAGTEVHYKDKLAKIKTSDGKIPLNFPKSITSSPGESVFEFIAVNNKILIGNNVFEGGSLKFERDKMFFDFKGNAKLNSLDIINENGIKTYIDFNGQINKNYDSAYISIDDEKGIFVAGSNINQRGVKISFNKDNPYGLKINDDDHFSVWSLGNSQGSYVKIFNRDSEGRIPKMETLNQYAINFDERGITYKATEGEIRFYPKAIVSGFQTKKSSVPIEIHNFRGSFDNPQPFSLTGGKPTIIGITDNVQYGYGTNPEFIGTTTPYKGHLSLKRGFSNSWLYYNMQTTEDFNRFFKGKATLVGTGYSAESLKKLTDIVGALPKSYWDKVGHVTIDGTGAWRVSGLARNNWIQVDSISDPWLVKHELGHTHTFEIEDKLFSDWNSISSSRGGFVSDYATTDNYEDVAETIGHISDPDYWKENKFLTTDYYAPVYRGKAAVLRKYGMITDSEFKALGLDLTKVQDYINEAKKFNRR